jgi:sulfate transport system ATP-binding protein
MTVFENVAFGLRVRPRPTRPGEAEIRARVEKLLDLVQLKWLADRYPSQLSGGQRQRIALARALAIEPQVLLLDEPFGALDARVRKELRRWLRSLHEDIHVTSVFVTHDQEEALEVADRVVVMDKGRIEQIGTPHEVYERPATAFVHEFIGEAIVVPVSIENGEVRYAGQKLDIASHGVTSGAARLFIRPYDIDIVAPEHAPLNGTVKWVHGLGPARRIEVALGSNQIVEIDVPRIHNVGAGEVVGLAPRQYRLFSAGG